MGMDLRSLNLASPIRLCSSARLRHFLSPKPNRSKSSSRRFRTPLLSLSASFPFLTPHCSSKLLSPLLQYQPYACYLLTPPIQTVQLSVPVVDEASPKKHQPSWMATIALIGVISFLFFGYCSIHDGALNSHNYDRCTQAVERGDANAWSNEEPVGADPGQKILQVVLVSPQIPGNTGCIARTCAASAIGLHLVGPLGFQVDDTKLKRAGLDYWPYVVVKVHSSWKEFRECFIQQEGEKRLLAFTKRGVAIHSDFSYRRGDWLVFGSETCGLPPEALDDCNNPSLGGGTIRIPMVETYVRCLNLSVSVGIAAYEASRQLNYEQLQSPLKACMDSEKSFVSEDIFA